MIAYKPGKTSKENETKTLAEVKAELKLPNRRETKKGTRL